MRNKKTGKRTLVYENCYKLGFFELSYVFDPADETAVVSRVIAASRTAGAPWSRPTNSDKDQAIMGGGHSLLVFPPHKVAPIHDPGTFEELAPGTGNERYEWVHTHQGEPINSGFASSSQEARLQAEQSHKELAGGWDPDQDPFDPRQFGASKLKTRSRTSNRRGGEMPFDPSVWYKRAFGETEAPEDIDTLRDESEDDTDLFHHWVQSPPELRAPNMDTAQQLDRDQEAEGLDEGRNVENAEPIGIDAEDEAPVPQQAPDDFYNPAPPGAAPQPDNGQQFLDDDEEDQDPVMPINPPEYKKSRRTKRSNRMSRYYYAGDDDDSDDNSDSDDGYSADNFGGSDDYPGENDYSDDGDSDDSDDSGDDDSDGGDDIHDLLDEAEDDIEQFENGPDMSGGDDFGDDGSDDFGGDDSGDDDGSWGDDQGDDDSDPEDSQDSEDSAPPWAGKESYFKPTVNRRASRRNRRGGQPMRTTLATRNSKGRHFQADSDGNTDGGVHGNYDGSGADESQGLQEDIFISQVPSAEAPVMPADDASNISNTPNNLVARYQAPDFDPTHYERLAEVVRSLPPAQRRAVADRMVGTFTADNRNFNWRTFFEAANVPVVKQGNRYFYAEDLVDAKEVDPSLSGTDQQDLKGDDFDSVALDNVETQPKDASIHAFRQFDAWLATATGKTAAQHGNANYIGRAAASYCKQFSNPQQKLATLFPTMEYVLHEARKVEGRNAMRRRAEDLSLETAAPDGRVDVEAPVKNVTDEKAQASQFDLGDFAHNAGDQLADPELDVVDGNAGTWAPDEGTKESSRKLASGTEAMLLAEYKVAAMPNTYRPDDRWKLAAMYEGKLRTAVRAEIRLLEAVLEDRKKAPRQAARKAPTASSRGTRGIPRGLGSRSRTAATNGLSANDPTTDGALFF
jgi:hypothetical protein